MEGVQDYAFILNAPETITVVGNGLANEIRIQLLWSPGGNATCGEPNTQEG